MTIVCFRRIMHLVQHKLVERIYLFLFHVYDASTYQIWGLIDGTEIEKILKNEESIYPVLSSKGQGFGVIWLVDYLNSTAGAYQEVIFSFLASTAPHTNLPLLDQHPIESVFLLHTQPELLMFVYRLWLSETPSIQYGRDIFCLDKRPLGKSTIFDFASTKFFISEHIDDSPPHSLFDISFKVTRDISNFYSQTVTGIQSLGLIEGSKVLFNNMLGNPVVSKVSSPKEFCKKSPYNADKNPLSYIYGTTKSPAFHEWNKNDVNFGLKIVDESFARFNFDPFGILHLPGFQFVYLPPHNLGQQKVNQ
eukprot:TRINITY_DN3301_c0_g1_i3.p1 TRINITY_DN3301_c0_g1~~TRINITY_DN3301_c0_g1_i3.p1  ORF type:complete len:306 (+),score=39.03 TRINITY_DN3301_c0_g1_i3:145-1062(+)